MNRMVHTNGLNAQTGPPYGPVRRLGRNHVRRRSTTKLIVIR
jgi:hypothetical protein